MKNNANTLRVSGRGGQVFVLSILFFLWGLGTATSCRKTETVDQGKIDDEIIRNYLTEHNIDAVKDSSGIYYQITREGNGNHPPPNAEVSVKYKGYLTDGTVFDQATSVVTFQLSQLIEGWKIGIPKLKPGGKGTFFIPSQLGYGSQATGDIPANSVLIFEIELVDFN